MAKKRRVEVRERSIFGDAPEGTVDNPTQDRFFLPGYSDKRVAWELAWRDYADGVGDKPKPLSHRFQFASYKERMTGADRLDKVPEFSALGYRPVRGYKDYERLTGQKLTDDQGRPLYAVREDAQGNLVVQSQLLMVCDADVAARNLRAERQRAARLEEGVESRAQRAAEQFNAALGLSRDGGTGFDVGIIEDDPAA